MSKHTALIKIVLSAVVYSFSSVLISNLVGMKQDDLVNLLEKEPDFKEAKPLLQEAIEKKGGRLLFGVKFHPELMMIESCYR